MALRAVCKMCAVIPAPSWQGRPAARLPLHPSRPVARDRHQASPRHQPPALSTRDEQTSISPEPHDDRPCRSTAAQSNSGSPLQPIDQGLSRPGRRAGTESLHPPDEVVDRTTKFSRVFLGDIFIMSVGLVVGAFTDEAVLKRKIRAHFTRLGFTRANDGSLILPGESKDHVRRLHASQRRERLDHSQTFLKSALKKHIGSFANGCEIKPENIRLTLVRVRSDTRESDLFRLATMTWSVPVSAGFGRRLRYLVWDEGHDRLAGVIALGDPVFNLSVRDNFIDWKAADRSKRLVNILDAYVLGAVPPYNFILGGKAAACLVRSREIYDDFYEAYGKTVGIISGEAKGAHLLAVTTTSSMGKSSIYNRLKLDGVQYMKPIGFTVGWGHFHIPDRLFEALRDYLRETDHRYADQHKFGEGPNWRLRTIRAALTQLGINESVLRHGIQREVFITTLAENAAEILRRGKGRPKLDTLLSAAQISELACERWIRPRHARLPQVATWQRDDIKRLIRGTYPSSELEKFRVSEEAVAKSG